MKYWNSKAKHSYLSVNKARPGKVRSEIVQNFVYSNKLRTTELELESETEPPS